MTYQIPPEQNLLAVRGDTFRKVMDLTFATGDLTGTTKLWMTVKRLATDADADALFQITSDPSGGITVNDAGSATFVVAADVMASLDARQFRYDVQCLLASGEIRTAARGRLIVVDQITQASA
jgi:hypothetical protein